MGRFNWIPYIFGGFDGISPRAKFTLRPSLAFSYIGSVTPRHSNSGVSQTLRRGTRNGITELSHSAPLYSAGRPSRWASVHILVCSRFARSSSVIRRWANCSGLVLLPRDAMLARYISVCLSVCLSVTSRCSILKRLNVGSRKQRHTTSPRTLVFWCWRYRYNSNGVTPPPNGGVKCSWDRFKMVTFDK